ncbi:DUF4174 domain-containing protein [Salinibacter altiplanensis]|uniref:DUF4174 domain-containing protein n=1 Tax=Salinibacter altiplanensis TaxID=1803181 RepID=UPI000C9F745C|nr:DUF4174 domain-containing protein [Salinibacter altiplanensis]
MRQLILACVFLLLPTVVVTTPADTIDFRLEDHRWEHRLLFVFAPSDTNEALAQQEDVAEGHDPGFRERDLLVLTVVGQSQGTQRAAPGAEPQPLMAAAARGLRERFDVLRGAFRVVLAGKDGTEKCRGAEPFPVRSLFDTIDAMPMRQREMREQDGGGE